MNCKAQRGKLSEALLRGDTAPGAEIAGHLRECTACRDFYEAQIQLLGQIDLGLRFIANEQVPASLLAEVRARTMVADVPKAASRVRISWVMPVTAAVVFALVVGMFHRREPREAGSLDTGIVAVRPVVSRRPVDPLRKIETITHAKRPGQSAGAGRNPETTPEVIVPAEEREAYERYVRETSASFSSPVQSDGKMEPIDIAPEEIAQLQIQKLELSSLVEEAQE